MGIDPTPKGLTERQQKWFASVQASLEHDTGKTLAQWVAIAKTCPETKPRARTNWLREHHGLGVNRAAHVLSVAFPSEAGWDEPDTLRKALWSDPASLEILETIETAIAETLNEVISGQRKGFTAFSRKVQFAAAKPLRGGGVTLGLAVATDTDDRLLEPKNEGWSERLKAKTLLGSASEVDNVIRHLLRKAWEAS